MFRLPSCLVLGAMLLWPVSAGRADTIGALHDGAHDDKELGNSAPPGVGGSGPFAAHNVELLAHLPLSSIGGTDGVLGNDIWGWTDRQSGREYALYGRSNGTSFVDVTDPRQPVYLGDLPTHTGNAAWRGIKVYQDHALIVADGNGNHGMQVFDLTSLRGVLSPQTFSEVAHYSGFANAHNIAVNEETGFAYAVGTNTASGGLHMVDVRNPRLPVAAGTFAQDGYTHDTQVVVYRGPDNAHVGREIAFAANEDTLTIVDVSAKNQPLQLARATYSQSGYSHQGWLTEDHRYFVMNDELDEIQGNRNTRTHIWNVADLDAPRYVGFYESEQSSVDHNLFIHEGLIYEANYTTGLRVLEPTDLEHAVLTEIGFLDTFPTNDNKTFDGAWGVYPFFESGTILVNDRQNGLFLVRVAAVPEPASWGLALLVGGLGVFSIALARRRARRS